MHSSSGAFCTHAHPVRDGRPGGSLAGLTFAVKDVYAVQGITACYGNPTWLETHAPAKADAHAVRLLLEAGANLRGVTLTDELALSLTGENAHYGTPLNTRAPDRVPGGSSSGSASAVAARAVDFALGTDTGGSVRVPASHCGLFGMRPTHGAVRSDGVLHLAPRFDTVGWFAGSATPLAKVGAVLLEANAARTHRFERFAVLGDARAMTDERAWTAFRSAASRVAEAARLPLSEASLGGPPIEHWAPAYFVLQNADALATLGDFLRTEKPRFGSLLGRRFAGLLAAAPYDTTRAEATRAALTDGITRLFESGTCVLLPSAPGAAPLRGLPDDDIDAYTGRGIGLTALASLCGLPQISLPLMTVDDCPFGLSILGPKGSDAALLELAVTIVSAFPDPGDSK
jgi:amidase